MKIFLSSIISGMEPFRSAAREAVEQLGHTAVMAEDFGAQPRSPQIACLDGLRQSALTVLIIGEQYGSKQSSGISATHEEFREARDRRPILAFFQEGVSHDADQSAFVKEAGSWEKGLFRESFTTPNELKTQITKRVHQWEVANAAGPVNEGDMLDRALKLLPRGDDRRSQGNFIAMAVAAGPRQALLRPSQLESSSFKKDVQKAALFGNSPIFSPEEKTLANIRNGALELSQGDDRGAFTLDGEGSLVFKLPLDNNKSRVSGMVIVEEDVSEALKGALSFAIEIWDTIDATQRISHAAIVCNLLSGNYGTWRTRAEQAASPDSYSIDSSNGERKPVSLNPAMRVRSALSYQRDELVDDLVTLLKRQSRSDRFR